MSFIRVYKTNRDPILGFLFGVGDLVDVTASSLMELAKIISSKNYRRQLEVKKIYRRLMYLQKKRVLLVNKRGLALRFILSDEVKKQQLLSKFSKFKILPQHKYLMVFFDIPESQRKTRSAWRYFLKENDFRMISQSVWITKRDLYREIKDTIHEFGVGEWINCCYATDFVINKK